MKNKKNLVVIFGGRSGEHDVSLMSAQSILEVLDPDRYNVTQIGITHQGAWLTGENVLQSFQNQTLEDLIPAIFLPQPGSNTLFTFSEGHLIRLTTIDCVFPVIHGTYGEDGTLQGFLELADVAYVGAGVLGSSVGMDKGLFKHVMMANNIPTLPYILLDRSEIQNDLDTAVTKAKSTAKYPLFVKPANLGSSVGINKCNNDKELIQALLIASKYDRRVVVEKGINAREIEISVLGNDNPEVSCAGEIVPKDIFYTYEDKYINGVADLLIPAEEDPIVTETLRELAAKAFKLIDGSGMARVDFLVDKDTGEYFLGEVNTIPGFTRISMYPKLWEASGLSYPNLINRLIDLAFERKTQRDNTVREYKL